MSDGVQFKITGGDELAKLLESRPPILASRIIRTSLRGAVQPWKQEMIARVRRGWHVFSHAILKGRKGQGKLAGGREREYGVIADHIVVKTTVDAGGFSGSAAVYPTKKAFWAKFLEFGTVKMRAFPFIRPAFESRKQEVLDRFVEDVKEQLRGDLDLR